MTMQGTPSSMTYLSSICLYHFISSMYTQRQGSSNNTQRAVVHNLLALYYILIKEPLDPIHLYITKWVQGPIYVYHLYAYMTPGLNMWSFQVISYHIIIIWIDRVLSNCLFKHTGSRVLYITIFGPAQASCGPLLQQAGSRVHYVQHFGPAQLTCGPPLKHTGSMVHYVAMHGPKIIIWFYSTDRAVVPNLLALGYFTGLSFDWRLLYIYGYYMNRDLSNGC